MNDNFANHEYELVVTLSWEKRGGKMNPNHQRKKKERISNSKGVGNEFKKITNNSI